MIAHAQKMQQFSVTGDPKTTQVTPPIIPQYTITPDSTGLLETFQPSGRTFTFNNAFFQNLGTNGRTCFTCHQPQEGWTVSAAGVADRFNSSNGTEPIFRLVDGAVCPTADVSNLKAKRHAYKLLIEKGLIRVGLPTPANAEFKITGIVDPYNCNTNPVTGLTGNPQTGYTGIVSVYRRPLPSTNVDFLSTVMWDGRQSLSAPSAGQDGRKSDLKGVALSATLVHAQAINPPTDAQLGEMADFMGGLFTAQIFDYKAFSLTGNNAKGGAVNLSLELSNYFNGVNDPVGLNPNNDPRQKPFTTQIFDLYSPWANPKLSSADGALGLSPELKNAGLTNILNIIGADLKRVTDYRQSVARGEALFNSPDITISGVSGLNDETFSNGVTVPTVFPKEQGGSCGVCHDSPNVGHHSVRAPLNIGIPNAGAEKPPVLDISGLPVFTVQCVAGPFAGKTYQVTDLGRAMITGKCAHIGRFKGPILRGLASRAPYFHNGSAASLMDVVNFYDQRFTIGFTAQQKTDLVNFLNTL